MFLSNRRQKTDGESKSGLRGIQPQYSEVDMEGCLPAHEVHTSIHADQGTGVHVPNHAIVLNWEIPPGLGSPSTSTVNQWALRRHGVCVCG